MLEKILATAQAAEASGQIAEADRLCDEALAAGHSYDALLFAARVAQRAGKHQKVAAHLKAAFDIKPSTVLRLQLVVAYKDAGDLNRAAAEALEGLAKKPKDIGLLNVHGVILKVQGRYKEAVDVFTRATRLDASNVVPWINLGNTWVDLENPARAIDYYFKVTRLAPKEGEYYRLLAGAHSRLHEYDKALRLLQQAASLSPQNPQSRIDIARVYIGKKEYPQALAELQRVLEQFPANPEALRDKGLTLRLMGRVQEAQAVFEETLRHYPNHLRTLLALGNLHQQSFGDSEKANRYFSEAYRLAPQNYEVVAPYVQCLVHSRYGNEAEHLDLAYKIISDFVDKSEVLFTVAAVAQSVFLRCTDFERLAKLGDSRALLKYWVQNMSVSALHNQLSRVDTMQDRYDLLEAHHSWGKLVEAEAAARPITHPAPRQRSTRTRIGLMSSDLRRHAATSFVSPFLEYYDRSKFELFCYSFSTHPPDDIQEWVVKTVDHFSCWPTMPDHEIAQRIASDSLDILFELGGTTYMNKVQVLAWKPAPVQASWLGYPHSCGLDTIDYLVVDPCIMPEKPDLLIEKPMILPETAVILGKIGFQDIPILPGVPEDRFSALTFGTMNNPAKLSPKVFSVWARVMKEVPGSFFHFVRPECGSRYFCENILAHFANNGIGAERIRFTTMRGKHMPFYNEIDIALDTFPQTGGATTCEALWMGVPTITLVGPAFFERLSYSNLTNAGLSDLCAFDIDSYVSNAVALAHDKKRRHDLRHGLRQQIRSHPLGQMERFVHNFETVIEKTLSSGKAS